jgi:4'-phosphopantetheinyl transferase
MMWMGLDLPPTPGTVSTEASSAFLETCSPALWRLPDLGVDVWTISLPAWSALSAPFRPLLSPEEQSHAGRFRRRSDGARYVSAHGALRIILAHYTDIDPRRFLFVLGPHGKPAIDRRLKLPDFRFNLSHSGDKAVIAVTLGREVGIDIERIEPSRADIAIAERFFSPREIAALLDLPEKDREHGFFACWTRKEAYIKGRGDGLSVPLSDFDVSLALDEPPALLGSRIDPSDPRRWRLYDVPVEEGYVASLAAECPSERDRDQG